MGTIKTVALAALWIATACPAAAQECQLCSAPSTPSSRPARPIHIDIETVLDFSTAAHTALGQGSVTIDPRTGTRGFHGLVGIGGPALRGTVTVTGEPLKRLTIDVPATIGLTSSSGAKADVTDIRTDLSSNAMIGANGRLVFSFGGKLTVRNDAAGDFHGRIRITANYQ